MSLVPGWWHFGRFCKLQVGHIRGIADLVEAVLRILAPELSRLPLLLPVCPKESTLPLAAAVLSCIRSWNEEATDRQDSDVRAKALCAFFCSLRYLVSALRKQLL